MTRSFARGLVELLVFLRRKPGAVRDFSGRPVGFRQVRKPVQPSVPHSGFEGLPQNNDFLVHRIPGRGLALLLDRLLVAVNPVFLYLAGRDLRKAHVAEEGQQVQIEPRGVALDVLGVALAFGDDLILALELRGGLAEGFLADELARARLAAQLQIPVFSEVLGLGEAVFLRGDAPVLAFEIGGALPESAVLTPVDVDLAAEDGVLLWHRRLAGKTAKLCNTCVSLSQAAVVQ